MREKGNIRDFVVTKGDMIHLDDDSYGVLADTTIDDYYKEWEKTYLIDPTDQDIISVLLEKGVIKRLDKDKLWDELSDDGSVVAPLSFWKRLWGKV